MHSIVCVYVCVSCSYILGGMHTNLAAVAQVAEQLSTYKKLGGLIPGSHRLHVEVSLRKILNPTLFPNCYECAFRALGFQLGYG